MEYVVQFVLSFLATAAFGVIFNAPIKVLPYCGVVGSIGWMMYYVMQYQVDEVQATFVGAFFVGVVAQVFAYKFKTPMIVFSVSGIIPLVPGGIAYNAMRNIIELHYIAGMESGMRAFMISGAIAMGLVFAEVLMQLILTVLRRGKTSIASFTKIKRQGKLK